MQPPEPSKILQESYGMQHLHIFLFNNYDVLKVTWNAYIILNPHWSSGESNCEADVRILYMQVLKEIFINNLSIISNTQGALAAINISYHKLGDCEVNLTKPLNK